ncbi:hypothetical protein [Amycolatopsis nigrescens]|uniref:hypothetical protein n=1 Tax=Amycolatopsis nigrescens TaxID=381445 RepID=UPI00036079E4|nr:hypothetical protein [Amycolatopsis nigrescens]
MTGKETEDIKDLFAGTGVEHGPPLALSAEDILRRGGRIRRRRKLLAAAGSATATAGVIVAIALGLPQRQLAPPPVEPAAPPPAVELTSTPPPTPTSSLPSPSAEPGSEVTTRPRETSNNTRKPSMSPKPPTQQPTASVPGTHAPAPQGTTVPVPPNSGPMTSTN